MEDINSMDVDEFNRLIEYISEEKKPKGKFKKLNKTQKRMIQECKKLNAGHDHKD